MFVYTIQPVVIPVVQFVWQPVVSCKRGLRHAGMVRVNEGSHSWLRGPAVEHRSLAGVFSLSCVRLVADG